MTLTKQDLTNISKITQTQIQTETRKIINGQSAMKAELIGKIDNLDKKLTGRIDSLEAEMKKGFKDVNKRIDTIGLHLENVDDDSPTVEEFDKLEKRVTKVETKISTI